jgi:acyl carrier protein
MRIELGEIESVLMSYPLVEQAVVVVIEGGSGQKRLVGYVKLKRDTEATIIELRSHLRQSLPEYMVPSTFVVLQEMPLTPNGKIDRKSLPSPDDARPELEQHYVPPTTDTQKAIAQIWSEILGIDEIGIHDNFFDLGGHSLTATRVVARIRTAFAIDLSLAEFFASATIKDVSEIVERNIFANSSKARVEEVMRLLESLDEREAEEMLALDNAFSGS